MTVVLEHRDALEALATVPLASLGDRALRETLADALALRNRAEAFAAQVIAECASRGLGPRDDPDSGRVQALIGEASPANLGSRERHALLRRARALEGIPLVAALHAENAVSTAFLDAVARGVRQLDADVREFADRVLSSPEGRLVDPDDVKRFCEQLLASSRPDRKNERALEQRSELRISAFGSDGAFAVNGTLYGLEGEFVQQLVQRYARPIDETDRRATTTAERNARALVDIARIAGRASSDPGHLSPDHGADAQLLVIATAEAVRGEPGAPAAITAGGQVVDPGAFAAVVCQARAGRIGTDVVLGSLAESRRPLGADSSADDVELTRRLLAGLLPWPLAARLQPLSFARGQRLAGRAQWLALTARDGHCVVPGCARQAYFCQAHHLREWLRDDGPTDLANLALVCWEHHAWLHRTGRHLHPPWCACHLCRMATVDDLPHAGRWLLLAEPPVLATGGRAPA